MALVSSLCSCTDCGNLLERLVESTQDITCDDLRENMERRVLGLIKRQVEARDVVIAARDRDGHDLYE